MILSPKEKFQQSQIRTSEWAQLTATPIFDEACNSALLQMLSNLPSEADQAYGSHMQVVGAQNLIRILKTIHEPSQIKAEAKIQGLNYQAGV
jgi:hypothetical protein